MPLFSYNAKDRQGAYHKGSIETADDHQAAVLLSERGLFVISIKIQNQKQERIWDKFLNRVSFSDIVVMTRQLSTMVESGLVLSEALDILVDQQMNKKFKEVLESVSRDVRSGLDLASSFRKHPDIFSPLYCNLVKAGESAGKLDIVLTQMATNLEKDREFRSRVRGAMIYPIIVITMMGIVMSIMMIFVIPRLTSLYTQSNIDLPLPTKILITVSDFFTHFWWLMILAFFGVGFLFKKWINLPAGKYQYDGILLRIPVVSKIVKGTNLTNFTRTFGLLTAAGIPILESLTLVSEVIGNEVYKRALQESLRAVERGLTLSAELESSGVFPKLVPQMFRVGEETGKVDQVSFKMAEYFETETDHIVKNLTVIIEPVILVVLGLGVAFLVLAIILPIYKLTTSFS